MKFKHLLYPLMGALFLVGATLKEETVPKMFSDEMTLEDRELSISAKTYTAEDSDHILHTDLVAQGYVPVEITIQNQGDHAYAISAASTSMSSEKPKDIAWKISKKSIPRGIGLKILSLFFWPVGIASTMDSIYTYKKHKSLVKVLTAKGFKQDDEIVLPYSLVKRILYIPEKAFFATFSVSLEDLTTEELVVVPIEVT